MIEQLQFDKFKAFSVYGHICLWLFAFLSTYYSKSAGLSMHVYMWTCICVCVCMLPDLLCYCRFNWLLLVFFSLFLRQFKLINFNFELIYGLTLLLFINSCCDTICFIIINESIMFSCRKNFYIAVFCKCWLSLNSLNILQYCSRAAIKIIFIVVSIYDSCQSLKHRLKSIEILSYHH